MLVFIVVLLWTAMVIALFRYLAAKRGRRALWRSVIALGLTAGLLRGGLASVGWYAVEHTGGPFQVPAFALAMLAWPEAALFGRHRGFTPLTFYPMLVLALTVSSLAWAASLALLVQITRGPSDRRGGPDG
jgi:hypothetical protein